MVKNAIFVVILTALASCSQLTALRFPSSENGIVNPTAQELIGIYTGTFDPPTNAHKEIMELALSKYHVDTLYIYVNISGTKDFKTSYLEREAMILGMLGENASKVKVMPVLQENKEAVIAAVDVVPGIRTVQFSGQDSFDTMPADVVRERNRKWVVIARSKEAVNVPENSNVEVLTPIDDTSSSEVRSLIIQNRLDEANVDPFVKKFIRKNNLYISPIGENAQLKENLYEQVFNEYIKRLKIARPDLNLHDVVLPKYLPEQSMAAWPVKFTNLIMTKENMTGKTAEEFSFFASNLTDQILITTMHSQKIRPVGNPCDPSEFVQMFAH